MVNARNPVKLSIIQVFHIVADDSSGKEFWQRERVFKTFVGARNCYEPISLHTYYGDLSQGRSFDNESTFSKHSWVEATSLHTYGDLSPAVFREGVLTTRVRFQNICERHEIVIRTVMKPHPYTPTETYLLQFSGNGLPPQLLKHFNKLGTTHPSTS